MNHSPPAVEIPELARMITQLLDKTDMAHLCLVNKEFRTTFKPLLWQDFDFAAQDPDADTPESVITALSNNLNLLRSIDLRLHKPDLLRILVHPPSQQHHQGSADNSDKTKSTTSKKNIKPCTTLTRLKFRRLFENYHGSGEHQIPGLLLSILHSNQQLTHIHLHAHVVLYYISKFTDAFLSLTGLQSLQISMYSIQDPVFTRAMKLFVELINHHPSLESILFGDWRGSNCGRISDGKVFYPDGEFDNDDIDNENNNDVIYPADLETVENEALEILQPHLRTAAQGGYPLLARIEFPPRVGRPCSATFLENFFAAGLPNLRTFTVPNVWPTHELGRALRNGCPKLEHITMIAGSTFLLGECHPILKSIRAPSSLTGSESHLFQRHAQTLTSLILPYVRSISSRVLHQILMTCKLLKVLKLEAAQDWRRDPDYADIDFKTGVWGCSGLEVLSVLGCGPFWSLNTQVDRHEYRRVESRTHFWKQVGRLHSLKELEIGSNVVDKTEPPRGQIFLSSELTLGGSEKDGHDSEKDPGQLPLLSELKELRVLKVKMKSPLQWVLPGQAEVEFMHANWPVFKEFSVTDASSSFSSSRSNIEDKVISLAEEPHWQWFKQRRPLLKVLKEPLPPSFEDDDYYEMDLDGDGEGEVEEDEVASWTDEEVNVEASWIAKDNESLGSQDDDDDDSDWDESGPDTIQQ
ncbi:hypothetical protein BGZ83_001827 [Gryganskiella cystojenkinii]|nr:hypothetical protein BGZ83_001827 [Gryganskiella cystojenkinii]